jgi:hypothetical protein
VQHRARADDSSRMRLLRVLGLLVVSLLAGACTTPAPTHLAADDCARWFAQLDAAVDAAGVRDAQEVRIDGYAGLRVDRFGAATRHSADFDSWLERAAELDRCARGAGRDVGPSELLCARTERTDSLLVQRKRFAGVTVVRRRALHAAP